MKTIYEWIQELPEPHRSRAMKYRLTKYEGDFWGEECKTIFGALTGSFNWGKTDEGLEYWALIAEGNYDEALKLVP